MIINTICAFSDSRVSQCYFFALWQLQPMFCWCNSKFYVAFDFDVWETIRNWREVRRTQFMRILWVNLSTVWPRKPWQGWRKAATIRKESSPSTNFQLLLSFATSRCFGAAPCVARIISSLTSFIRFVNWQLSSWIEIEFETSFAGFQEKGDDTVGQRVHSVLNLFEAAQGNCKDFWNDDEMIMVKRIIYKRDR